MPNTVLITGAGRGIGLATARAFLNAGWKVFALDKDFSSFDLPGAERIQFDLRNLSEIEKLVESTGQIHTLVNNAGVLFCDPYEAIPEQNKREVLTVNIEAPAALITALAPQMKKRKSGRIVNVGSVAAFTGHPDLWYGITKAGILNLTKAWAKELGPHGVLVNAVAPGPTQTAMYDQLPQSQGRRDEKRLFGPRLHARGGRRGDPVARQRLPGVRERDYAGRQQRFLSALAPRRPP